MVLFDCGIWLSTSDGDPKAFAIFCRHYSYREYKDQRRLDWRNPNRFQFVGPGEKLVYVTAIYDGLFVWRKFIDDSGQQGVNCAVFRNESSMRASDMILAAEELAWRKWPGERLYTYVDPEEVNGTCPGYCFRRAKWKSCGRTKSGLLILEKNP